MKKGETYKGEVLALKFPNKGVVKEESEGELVQVKNVLPGQRISFCLTKNRRTGKRGGLWRSSVRRGLRRKSLRALILNGAAAVLIRRWGMRRRRS